MRISTPNQDGLRLTDARIGRVISQRPKRPPRHQPGDEFLKGPIPIRWLKLASCLPGKALAVGIVVWFKAGATKRRTVRLCSQLRGKLELDRRSTYRGLKALEGARLVDVQRHPGRCPVVTILEVPEPNTAEQEGGARG